MEKGEEGEGKGSGEIGRRREGRKDRERREEREEVREWRDLAENPFLLVQPSENPPFHILSTCIMQ